MESKFKNYEYSKYQGMSSYEDTKYQVIAKDANKNY